jgi:hypothetical protein
MELVLFDKRNNSTLFHDLIRHFLKLHGCFGNPLWILMPMSNRTTANFLGLGPHALWATAQAHKNTTAKGGEDAIGALAGITLGIFSFMKRENFPFYVTKYRHKYRQINLRCLFCLWRTLWPQKGWIGSPYVRK